MRSFRTHVARNPIPLDARLLDGCDRPQIEKSIREIVRSVKFEFLERERAIRLLGPDTYYHAIDPHLPAALQRFDPPLSLDDIVSYRSQEDPYDLCFEDSWSGYLIADYLRRTEPRDDLVILHLDDHTDMMSTLLECSEGGLFDPTVGQPFEPQSPASWEAGIYSGGVSIGCFVTPFYFAGLRTHVHHLNNTAGAPLRAHAVLNDPRGYPMIPNKQFASVKLANANDAPTAGTYVVSSRCEDLLDSLPRRRVIVHVDLDYFINDFNGNPEARRDLPDPALVAQGRRKLDHFFDILQARRIDVEHWVIATSPGFCSACHWSWLLNEFAEKIRCLHAAH